MSIKKRTWIDDAIEAYNYFGGDAPYSKVYPKLREIRLARGATWTRHSEAVLRRTVEEHSEDSDSYKPHNKPVFYSVNGLGKGVWGLLPQFRVNASEPNLEGGEELYIEGMEGINREYTYLRKSRDPKLVESRKKKDKFTCQACGYFMMLSENKYIIDVHHINPIGRISETVITSLDDLVCLCPNCHRIAHSNKGAPMKIDEIKGVLIKKFPLE